MSGPSIGRGQLSTRLRAIAGGANQYEIRKLWKRPSATTKSTPQMKYQLLYAGRNVSLANPKIVIASSIWHYERERITELDTTCIMTHRKDIPSPRRRVVCFTGKSRRRHLYDLNRWCGRQSRHPKFSTQSVCQEKTEIFPVLPKIWIFRFPSP